MNTQEVDQEFKTVVHDRHSAIVPSPVPGEKEYIYRFVVSMPLMMILIAAFLKYFKIF